MNEFGEGDLIERKSIFDNKEFKNFDSERFRWYDIHYFTLFIIH
jgi:hypothetical protein